LDKTEEGIDDATKKDSDKKKTEDNKNSGKPAEETTNSNSQNQTDNPGSLASYGKYDFVPGDKIIFEDDFSAEALGEFPSKWKLLKGAAENINSDGHPCLGFTQVSSQVSPLMKTENFLPKIFTLEFDIYYYTEGNEAYTLRFGTRDELDLRLNKVSFGQFTGAPVLKDRKGWHHIAIAVNDKKMKVYFNESRVLNIPEIGETLQRVVFSSLSHGAAKGKPAIIKSVRIAEGGMELYKRIMTDGKYIASGILFDVNKATLKPQSMGPINEMVKLMKEHSEMKFSIEGHTDSDGDEKANQNLSEERAQAVKAQITDNSTAEGKANNRRVEFVKK
jgi:outer membrane protein OmpA-like peptidoglycan-associated protein